MTISLSRNRALSNTALLKFDRADLALGLHDNSVSLTDSEGKRLQGFPGADIAPVDYEQLFRNFYGERVVRGNTEDLLGGRFLQVQALLQDIYSAPELLKDVF